MSRLRVGFIGTGKKKDRPDAFGFAMAYAHAQGYQNLSAHCELVACADIIHENAAAFADYHAIPATGVFTDYERMLAETPLDIVSICTWPHLHAPMVIAAARAGVRAIHCEKPMADTWGDARLMSEVCAQHGVKLTFNHQRRFGLPFSRAADLVRDGSIGELQRVEIACGNIYDYGTHYIDLCGLYVNEQGAEWVHGQIDYRAESRVFGAHIENQAIATWRYPSGVFALIATGASSQMVGSDIRLRGTTGTIEIGNFTGSHLRISTQQQPAWQRIETEGDDLHGPDYVPRAIADVVQALLTGNNSMLCAQNALNATEIIFAIYESSRQRARIDLPLTITDNPLTAMVESGALQPVLNSAYDRLRA